MKGDDLPELFVWFSMILQRCKNAGFGPVAASSVSFGVRSWIGTTTFSLPMDPAMHPRKLPRRLAGGAMRAVYLPDASREFLVVNFTQGYMVIRHHCKHDSTVSREPESMDSKWQAYLYGIGKGSGFSDVGQALLRESKEPGRESRMPIIFVMATHDDSSE